MSADGAWERGAKAGLEAAAKKAEAMFDAGPPYYDEDEIAFNAGCVIAKAIRALPLPADPASGGGEDARMVANLEQEIEDVAYAYGNKLAARDAEIAAMRAALTPFARAARLVEKEEPTEKSLFSSSARHEIKLSDLLQARDTLAKLAADQDAHNAEIASITFARDAALELIKRHRKEIEAMRAKSAEAAK